jgi:hypothetical protein
MNLFIKSPPGQTIRFGKFYKPVRTDGERINFIRRKGDQVILQIVHGNHDISGKIIVQFDWLISGSLVTDTPRPVHIYIKKGKSFNNLFLHSIFTTMINLGIAFNFIEVDFPEGSNGFFVQRICRQLGIAPGKKYR